MVTPVLVAGQVWGVLAATAPESDGLDADDERRLTEFGDLLAMAITSIEDRNRLAAQASSDALTGLANRRMLSQRLAAELARSVRRNASLSVAVIDVDRFKQINDHGGHEAGDEVLIWVAKRLAALARPEDILARIGGDEFAWVLPETDREQALAASQRARHAIAQTPAGMPEVTVSVGVCDSRTTSEPSELIRCADLALYLSKQQGRDQVQMFDQNTPVRLAL